MSSSANDNHQHNRDVEQENQRLRQKIEAVEQQLREQTNSSPDNNKTLSERFLRLAKDNIQKNSSNRLQRNLSRYSTAGVFFVSLVVALVSIIPLYNKLKAAQEQDLQAKLSNRTLAAEEVLQGKIQVAEQVTSRTFARRILSDYVQGEASLTEVQELSSLDLEGAINQSKSLVGVSRFDHTSQLLVHVGVDSPLDLSEILQGETDESITVGPLTIDNHLHLLVSIPIFSGQQGQIGRDIAVFRMFDMERLVAESRGLGETGEMLLAKEKGETFVVLSLTKRFTGAARPLGSCTQRGDRQRYNRHCTLRRSGHCL